MLGESLDVTKVSTAPAPRPVLEYWTRSQCLLCNARWWSKVLGMLQILSVKDECRKDRAGLCDHRSIRFPVKYLSPVVVRNLSEG